MPVEIKVTRYKPASSDRVELAVKLAFDAHDPIGANVYAGLDALVGSIMSRESAEAFRAKIVALRTSPRGGTVSGRVKG